MASVCFYFQIHQPLRLRRYSVFDTDQHYFDDYKNAEICRKVAHKCYLPANRTLLDTDPRARRPVPHRLFASPAWRWNSSRPTPRR